MREIRLSNECSFYPVGENIIKYFDICKEIGMHINKQFPNKSITLWCRGSSGAIIAALVSQYIITGVEICHVKKKGEDSHVTEVTARHDINIIIDDLMASGDTLEKIVRAMDCEFATANCVIMTGCIKPRKLKMIFGDLYENLLIIGGYIEPC